METVYRVEDETGRGPYVNRREIPHADGELWASGLPGDRWPLPWQDGISHPGDTWNWRFGFASLPAFCRWFDARDRARLKEIGLAVVRYLVPAEAVRHGGKQVIFRVEDAQKAETLDPTTV